MTKRTGSADVVFAIGGCLLFIALPLWIAIDSRNEITQLRREAIEHGYARYNATTGKWEWVETETGER